MCSVADVAVAISVLLSAAISCANGLPHGEFRIQMPRQSNSSISTLTLPSNATAIRDDIVDTFSCENKTYGYYADVDNDCQIFHVCLPVTFADGKNQTFRWSFICPESTVFSQEIFVCVREYDLTIKCEESVYFYDLNESFGDKEQEETMDGEMSEDNMDMDMQSMDDQERQDEMSDKMKKKIKTKARDHGGTQHT